MCKKFSEYFCWKFGEDPDKFVVSRFVPLNFYLFFYSLRFRQFLQAQESEKEELIEKG